MAITARNMAMKHIQEVANKGQTVQDALDAFLKKKWEGVSVRLTRKELEEIHKDIVRLLEEFEEREFLVTHIPQKGRLWWKTPEKWEISIPKEIIADCQWSLPGAVT